MLEKFDVGMVGGLFGYCVTPGPFFWEFDTEFWVQSLDLDLDLGLDLNLDTGPDLELDNIDERFVFHDLWMYSKNYFFFSITRLYNQWDPSSEPGTWSWPKPGL